MSKLVKSKEEVTLANVLYYIQGTIRYHFFYHKYLKKLIRLHIFEQITYRILVMDPECYAEGYCKMCGCNTTALQMADKPCNKPCYPKMMSKKDWGNFKKENKINLL